MNYSRYSTPVRSVGPGNAPGVKIKAELVSGAPKFHVTYSVAPYQNMVVPNTHFLAISDVSLKTLQKNPVVWGTITDSVPNPQVRVWERAVYFSPDLSTSPGFWLIDAGGTPYRKVCRAEYARLEGPVLYVAYVR